MDAAIISAAQRVEHYEIAAYGSVHAYATILGETEAASLLEQTLNEEKETDQRLTDLSESINEEANQTTDLGTAEAEQEERPKHRTARAGSTR